jgi:hypothetical protein
MLTYHEGSCWDSCNVGYRGARMSRTRRGRAGPQKENILFCEIIRYTDEA